MEEIERTWKIYRPPMIHLHMKGPWAFVPAFLVLISILYLQYLRSTCTNDKPGIYNSTATNHP